MSRPIRTLLFSTLYPSAARPTHGIFVETRLRELLRSGEVETKVVAPVPWFPFRDERFGEYARFAATPLREQRYGIEVIHPRYMLPPRIGMRMAPYALAVGAWPAVRRIVDSGFDFDVIDAHYYYPDGVAAGLIAGWLGKPFVVTARGTDINLIPEYPGPRRAILRTARKAAASIGVCQALVERLALLGVDGRKLHVLRNGVDLQRFRPEPRDEARRRLDLEGGPWLLSVASLIESKGHHIAIEALSALAAARLLIAGEGPERPLLEALARRVGVHDRVRFVGIIPNEELRWWYSAADVSLLCSSREGWANVLLESMACGTPVVATNIGGTPEVVASPEAGRLTTDRTPAALASAVTELLAAPIERQAVRAYAQRFSWDATTAGQLELFRRCLRMAAGKPGCVMPC